MANQNRLQINLNPSGSDTTRIIGNMVLGDELNTMVDGISCSSLLGGESHAIISDNEGFENRYGITSIGGNVFTLMQGNIIEGNSIQGDPFLGGSGININGAGMNFHTVINNEIRDNLWGFILQGDAMSTMGDTTAGAIGAGTNTFSDNENDGVAYALFNNTPNATMAQGNCWIEGQESTREGIENLISHQMDDEAPGLVDFSAPLCALITATARDIFESEIKLLPNLAHEKLWIERPGWATQIIWFDIAGRPVLQHTLKGDAETVALDVSQLPAGIHVAIIKCGD